MSHDGRWELSRLNRATLTVELRRLLVTGEHSDLIITCNGHKWSVHKAIVCLASDFFQACCKNFKVRIATRRWNRDSNLFRLLALRSSSQRMLKTNSDLQEASSGVIDLPDDRADAVNALLWYAYTANYDDTKECRVSDGQLIPRPMLFNVLVHTVGDKYGMRNLCQLPEAKFEKHATTGWRSDGFADAIVEMSLTSPDSKRVLLKIAAEIAITHAADLFTGEETRFQETVRNVAPFAFKVTSILLESRRSNLLVTEKRLRCVICAKSFIIDTNPGTTSISCWYCGICQYVDRFEALEI